MTFFQNMTWGNWQLKNLSLSKIVLILVLLNSFGCSSAKLPLPVVTEIPQPESRPNLPDPEPIKTQEVDWIILTDKNIIKEGEVFIALTPKNYEDLSLTMSDILRWIKEANWRLKYYKGEGIKQEEND